MDIVILLYPDFTALDAIGPYEVLRGLPGARVRFVSLEAGPVTADTGMLTIVAEAGIADIDQADFLLVPGGPGSTPMESNETAIAWVKKIHETTQWTTSVCSGALILAAAGLLDGLDATTHWAVYDRLAEYGAKPTEKRLVRNGKIVTAAGVSAGIDMALTVVKEIAGDDFAQAIQLALEYDPQPPFDAGAPSKAPAHIVEMVRAFNLEAQNA